MKKIVLFVVCLIALSATAQPTHIKFKGIELGCTSAEFTYKMQEVGFKKIEEGERFIRYKGNFAGEEREIGAQKIGDKIASAMVVCEEHTSWTSLKHEYNDWVESFTRKYGEPTYNSKSFKSPYYDGDGYEMSAVSRDYCVYGAKWMVEGGDIMVIITKNKNVVIYYTDMVIEQEGKNQKQKQIDEDI